MIDPAAAPAQDAGMTSHEEHHTPCVRSGFCCKRGPCVFGLWDADKSQCAYLEGDAQPGEEGIVLYRCARYEFIVQQPGHEFSPAFGAGCCSSLFNTERQKILRWLKSKTR